MQADSIKKIVGVALGVCLICSILVSAAAVSLSSIQAENKKIDRLRNILMAADLYDNDQNIEAIYNEKIETDIINLSEGKAIVEAKKNDVLSVDAFDIRKVASNPEYSELIPPKSDLANIKRKPQYMPVSFVRENGEIKKIILPIHGKGLWSTMYGFVALGADLQTVEGFTYYEHGETPGLGGEVDNPRWKASWKGKTALNETGKVVIEVLKGSVNPSSPDANKQIDGLAGATITTRGVDYTLKFWLGDQGYGPLLDNLRKEKSENG